jgi:hypothetical protein
MERSWMYNLSKLDPSYRLKIYRFIDAAKRHACRENMKHVYCPCIGCKNIDVFDDIEEIILIWFVEFFFTVRCRRTNYVAFLCQSSMGRESSKFCLCAPESARYVFGRYVSTLFGVGGWRRLLFLVHVHVVPSTCAGTCPCTLLFDT